MTVLNQKPDSGKYVTSAVLSSKTNYDGATEFDDQVIARAQYGDYELKADVVAKDTYTGELVHLNGVRIKTGEASITKGITQGQQFELTAPSYEAFLKRKVDQFELSKVGEKPIIQNPALPQPATIRNSISTFAESNSPTCKRMNQKYDALKRKMGLIHDRDDIVIYGGTANGRAPGMVVHQANGALIQYDTTGKQYTQIDPSVGILHNAPQVDVGSADKTHTDPANSAPMKYNKVNETVPQGTIIIPEPMSLPNLLKVYNMVQSVADICELIYACGKAMNAFMTGNVRRMTEVGSENYGTPAGDVGKSINA